MDVRQQKAEEIAARAAITKGNGYYLVPSQTDGKRHRVVLDSMFPTCSCPDYELREKDCKHILAVRLWLQRQAVDPATPFTPGSREPSPKAKRPTYPQDWVNYNAAQTNERRHFQGLLHDLCATVPEPPRKPGRGRKPIPMADAVFAAVYKVYSGFSARRFTGELEEAHRRRYVARLPHFNSVLNVFDNEAVTPILVDLVRASALPLNEVETKFATDSSGFCTSRFIRWFDVKYGVTREEAEWVKVHIATGVQTNVVTAVEILDKHANDCPQFPALIDATARGFRIAEASADKAYTATANFEAVAKHGGTLYAPFKKNATGAIGGIYEKMFHYFCLHREEFLKHYHARSNVESTFSAVKRKFGDSIRSKTDTAMKNEVLAKFVAHNVCCLVSAMYELGLDPVFGADDDGPRDVLPFVRRG
jgi:transposase